MTRAFVHRLIYALVLATALLGCFHKTAQGEVVYDPWNYKQNYIENPSPAR